MSITIYSKPDCVQCSATCQVLSRRNIPYQIVDLTENPQALATIRAMATSKFLWLSPAHSIGRDFVLIKSTH